MHQETDTMPRFAVVVRWEDPDPGAAAYGPYATEEEAQDAARNAATGILADFADEGELPEDVGLEVQEMAR